MLGMLLGATIFAVGWLVVREISLTERIENLEQQLERHCSSHDKAGD